MSVSFAWPFALILLPLPLLWRFFKQRSQPQANGPYLPEEIAQTLVDSNRAVMWPSRIRTLLLWCIWIAIVCAVAQPRVPMGIAIEAYNGRDLMLVVDLSGSMEKQDFTFDDTKVTRLDVVKRVAGDFVMQRQGDRLGLTLFADEAYVASPLTFDLNSVRHYIDEARIGLAGRSTALGDAMGLGLRRLNASTSQSRILILLTDGSNNAGDVAPDSAAQLANQLGIRIHTIALGADSMTIRQFGEDTVVNPSIDLDTDALQQIAEQSGGQFYRAKSTDELRQVYADIDQLERSEQPSPPFVPQRDLRIIPMIVALLGLVVLGLLNHRRVRVFSRPQGVNA